jgi:hypothetical protein
MKSMSVLFLAAAGLALYLAGIGVEASGRTVLVSSSVSPETWRRACSFAGPDGLRTVEVEAHETCDSAGSRAPAGPVRQATLAR